jgi:hypothetical protein
MVIWIWWPSSMILLSSMGMGIATSIWNHSVTNKVAMYADRTMMWIGFATNLFLIFQMSAHAGTQTLQRLCLFLLFSSALVYALAKWLIRSFSRIPIHPDTPVHSGTHSPTRHGARGNIPHILAHATLTVTHTLLLMHYSKVDAA